MMLLFVVLLWVELTSLHLLMEKEAMCVSVQDQQVNVVKQVCCVSVLLTIYSVSRQNLNSASQNPLHTIVPRCGQQRSVAPSQTTGLRQWL